MVQLLFKDMEISPKVRNGFESEIDDLYVAGDGAGLTRGLAQAGANGILVARHIVENIK